MVTKDTTPPRRTAAEIVREMQEQNAHSREIVLRNAELLRQIGEAERRRARWRWWR